jgi:hypothetical protein
MGWLTIWNAALEAAGKPPLDLSDRNQNQVWRFELRLGSKQLRNRFEMRNWQDIHDMIGDTFTDALSCFAKIKRNLIGKHSCEIVYFQQRANVSLWIGIAKCYLEGKCALRESRLGGVKCYQDRKSSSSFTRSKNAFTLIESCLLLGNTANNPCDGVAYSLRICTSLPSVKSF